MNAEPRFTLKHRLARRLQSHWRDLDAPHAVAQAFRGRQFHDVLGEQLLAALGNVMGALIIVAWFWTQASHALLLGWALCMWLICGSIVWQRFKYRGVPLETPPPRFAIRLLSLRLGIVGLLFGLMAGYLFGQTDEAGRILLTGMVSAFVAVGALQFSALALAGVAWAVMQCLGLITGLAWFYGSTYLLLIGLTAIFMVYTAAAVLTASQRFLSLIKAEHDSQEQRGLVDLLLHDFETNASDWLWETDRQGQLLRIPARLAEALDNLGGTGADANSNDWALAPLADLLESLAPERSDAQNLSFEQLRAALAGAAPFQGIVVMLAVGGNRQWWSVGGKPLRNASGEHTGWRGVGNDVTLLRKREREMQHQANQDALTGLANRRRFTTVLGEYFDLHRGVAPCTLMMLDLDNFKAVNDALGHAVGDLLLVEVGRRLSEVVTEGELLARLGGDEFAVLIPKELPELEAGRIGARLIEALSPPWVIEGYRLTVRTSLGLAFAPKDANNPQDLLKCADMALYAAKAAGRNTLRPYAPHLGDQSQRKIAVVHDLADGLARGEFTLVYQPQVDFASGRVIGFEALLRWNHPRLGAIPPSQFIPIAEESGLIVQLGAWVIRQACQQATRWPNELTVAVNVSAIQFANSDVRTLVQDALLQSGLPARRLEIEITESTLMDNKSQPMQVLRALRELGVRVALDDFGTGYSSLSYLRTFPLDKLKIDRSFVIPLSSDVTSFAAQESISTDDADARAIVRSIIQLAQALRLDTTAEGVETASQWATLQEMGCVQAQGYLVAKPMDSLLVPGFLHNWRGQIEVQQEKYIQLENTDKVISH